MITASLNSSESCLVWPTLCFVMFQYYCSCVPHADTMMHTGFEHFSDAFCYFIEVKLNSMSAITLVHSFESIDDLSSLQTGILGS